MSPMIMKELRPEASQTPAGVSSLNPERLRRLPQRTHRRNPECNHER